MPRRTLTAGIAALHVAMLSLAPDEANAQPIEPDSTAEVAPTAPDPAAAPAPDAPAPAPVAETPVVAPEPADVPTTAEILTELKAVKAAYDALKGDSPTPKKLLWAALIAALASALMIILKRVAQSFGHLLGKGKKAIPWIVAGLSAVSAIALYYAGGQTLFWSVFYGGSALGAVILHELGIGVPSKA